MDDLGGTPILGNLQIERSVQLTFRIILLWVETIKFFLGPVDGNLSSLSSDLLQTTVFIGHVR